MDSNLLRQRRNLMLVSGGLIVSELAQIKIAKISLLGTELTIGNPNSLQAVAWTIWAYFFLRYYQRLRQEKDLKIRSTFSKHIKKLAGEHTGLKKSRNDSGERLIDFRLQRSGIFDWKYSLHDYDAYQGDVVEQVSKPVPTLCVLTWLIRSTIHASIHTPRVTDHVLPVLMGALAPVTALL